MRQELWVIIIGMKPLWCHGPALIIEHPTGIAYTGQVGGVACMHPIVEGFLLPFGMGDSEVIVEDLRGVSCPTACYGGSLTEECVEELVHLWPTIGYGGVEGDSGWRADVDTTRAVQGTECWFPIRLRGWRECRHLHDKTGWLLMPDNCD